MGCMNERNKSVFVMLIKKRVSPADYDRFIAFNQRHEGAHVDLPYLNGAKAYVFVRPNAPNAWVSAYAINTNPQFRCLFPLTPAQRAEAMHKGHLTDKSTVEITLLCRDKNLGWLPGEQAYFYRSSIIDALKTGKKHLIGATANPNLLPKLMIILDQVIVEGEVDYFGKPRYGWVISASRLGAVWNISRHLVGLWLASVTPKRRRGTTPSLPTS